MIIYPTPSQIREANNKERTRQTEAARKRVLKALLQGTGGAVTIPAEQIPSESESLVFEGLDGWNWKRNGDHYTITPKKKSNSNEEVCTGYC
jgi:hypothetical protein